MATRRIIDPHHHLWRSSRLGPYLLPELWDDIGGDPEIVATMFMECRAEYRTDGPDYLRPVGETAFVAGEADRSDQNVVEGRSGPPIVGIVGGGDLTLPIDRLDELLDAHVEAAGGRFRGIRDALSSAPPGRELFIPGRAAPDKAADEDFRRGVRHLGARGFTYDSWHYHTQNPDLLALARACPDTTIVLDHFGTPLDIGPDHPEVDDVFAQWRADIADLASCPNVVAKAGGLAMPDNGFGWHEDPTNRPDVDAFVAAQGRWYHALIEAFGPSRCMFESNFPVDRLSLDYGTYWEACRRIAAAYDEAEQHDLFAATTDRVYSLGVL